MEPIIGYLNVIVYINAIPFGVLAIHNFLRFFLNKSLKIPMLVSFATYIALILPFQNYIPNLHLALTVPLALMISLAAFYYTKIFLDIKRAKLQNIPISKSQKIQIGTGIFITVLMIGFLCFMKG